MAESYAKNRVIPWQGGHDEGTYLTAWREYFICTQDPIVPKYAFEMLTQLDQWAKINFVHGYYRKHEVHHGIENFVIYLAWIMEMDPTNEIVRRLLRDAALNIIHPPNNLRWFDWESNRFTSLFLGTEVINPSMTLNIPEHFRMIRLAWLGLAAGGDPELGKLIMQYCTEWANQIVNSEALPFYLARNEPASPENDQHFQDALKKFMGAAPKQINNRTRAEYHIANGVPDVFFALYENTHNKLFLDAAERILKPTISQLSSPYAHPLGELIWHLFRLGRIPDLPQILSPLQILLDSIFEKKFEISFQKRQTWQKSPYFNTIGIRKDMPALKIRVEKSFQSLEIPSPASLGLLYRITQEDKYLSFALDFAAAILTEASKQYPEGRHHGCSARMIHSFCIGHGRNWGAGFTSTVLRAAIGPDCYNIPLPKIPL